MLAIAAGVLVLIVVRLKVRSKAQENRPFGGFQADSGENR